VAWDWFGQKHAGTAEWTGFLEKGVKLEGTLETAGLFRIDSDMKGTLISRETLIIGEHASVAGEIIGNQVVIWGRFEGTIRASGRVEIQPKAIVSGEIRSPCVLIEPGALFDGQCQLVPSPTSETAKPILIAIRSAVAQS
jgi:cytoskeletal protein CcmA (bactofilin family)